MQPDQTPSTRPLFLDPAQPLADRVADLVGRMTLEEKLGQLVFNAPAIARLGIPAYNWWGEALHGIARNGRATVFPQAIGMAATWDPNLIERVASAIGDEGRAKYHATLRRYGETGHYQGLTFWSPNVNIFRDPRWGRGQETWGEDPYLTGELGAAFVRGLQGDDPRYLKAAACAKHYAVHSGPESKRHAFDAQVSPRDLHTTYLPAFKKLVTEAKVEAVMGAYNRINGEACCASELLLVDILRGEWDFQGHVVSDCWALNDLHTTHGLTADGAESAALAVKRGCDLECGQTFEHLGAALERGLLDEIDIDRAVTRIYTTRFKLGMFDPQEQVPFSAIPESVINSDAHRQLAYAAALKSVVLLKNANNILPLRDLRSLYVLGPTAANAEVLMGNYYGVSESLTTLIEGIVARTPEGVRLEYRPGTLLLHVPASPSTWTTMAAARSDVVIACMGLSPQMEGEEGDAIESPVNGDRVDIGLPAVQADYLRLLKSNGARLVLVLTGGSAIALGDIADLADAILFVWYPGQEGGAAVADVLFGAASPSGKLPLTFPASLDQLPLFEEYNMAGRTYRYASEAPLYPFGFGLSYTRFIYRSIQTPDEIKAGAPLTVQVKLTNAGAVDAEEVVQLYLSKLEPAPGDPFYTLVGFERMALAAGETRTLDFTLSPDRLATVDDAGKVAVRPGAYRLIAGGSSPGLRSTALGAATPVETTINVIQ
ncbi:MAG: glycoside hydrolase family 3 C-terminal domain-containing protein [Anaerolineales bacterium]|nr:glycoside hydrolase family 3 C-terminal domain-containing protein [Anaerolineales bacterium]